MSINFDKRSIEKRHDRRFLGIFLMFVVIAVFVGIFIAFSVSGISGYGIFDGLFKSSNPTTPQIPDSSTITPNGNLENIIYTSQNKGMVVNCTDTEGGINPFLKGTCTGINGNFTDVCYTNTSIKEYYCASNNTCQSLIGNCTWFKNISTGRCIGGMCELKPQVANEINALMLSMISGVKIREKKGVDLATLNIQSARTNGDNPVVDGIFGGFGAKCDCIGCSGAGDCASHNDDFLGCMATNCQCASRQDPSWCFWNVETFGYWAW